MRRPITKRPNFSISVRAEVHEQLQRRARELGISISKLVDHALASPAFIVRAASDQVPEPKELEPND